MSAVLANEGYTRHIDSFQKLRFLLFLYHHPDMKGTCREFGERLYFGHTPGLEEMIGQLYLAGLIERTGNCYQLCQEPAVWTYLQQLAGDFENPLTRQQMLDQVRHAGRYYQEAFHLA